VRFTKCLYAQMTKQQFFPPRGLVLPPKSDPEYASTERGIKLAAAFEMLYHKNPPQEDELSCFLEVNEKKERKREKKEDESSCFLEANGHVCARDSGGAGGEAGDSAHTGERIGEGGGGLEGGEGLPKGEAWASFLGGLKKIGYFRQELQGSELFRELLSKAVAYYRRVVGVVGEREGGGGMGVTELIDQLLVGGGEWRGGGGGGGGGAREREREREKKEKREKREKRETREREIVPKDPEEEHVV
jgi:hypothetical protein